MSFLERKILSTIAYYDVLDFPLTSFEIWKYLISNEEDNKDDQKNNYYGKSGLSEIVSALESEELKNKVDQFRCFFFLRGRKNLVFDRLRRNKISEKKIRLTRSIISILRYIPFVRMVALTGRVAMKNADNKSDLDFLIVLKEGKIFTGRILITLILHFMGKRRYGRKIKNRACLNFFLTEEAMEINLKDIYSSSEYSFIFPFFGFETFLNFQKENFWIKKFRPNFSLDETRSSLFLEDSFFSKKTRKILEFFFSGSFFERNLKKWQMKRILKDPRTYKRGSGVMAGDQFLIFLPEPHGPKIFEKYQKKLKDLGFS